jgi:ABC-type antimicrobial peptide transport system permease subunit
MWIPMSLAPELNGQGTWLLENRDERQMWITARLRDGVTMEQARAEVIACARRMAQSHPNTNRGFSATLVPVWRGHLGAHSLLRTPLQILMAVSLLLFLIVAANVANLQLVRLASRRKEFSLRVALGAGAGRLVRQLLTESLLLSVAGALGGAVLATVGARGAGMAVAANQHSHRGHFEDELARAGLPYRFVCSGNSADRRGAFSAFAAHPR